MEKISSMFPGVGFGRASLELLADGIAVGFGDIFGFGFAISF